MRQATQQTYEDLLKPALLNSVDGLVLLSKMIIGGYLFGQNQSIRTGQGQVFRQYRSYQPGDDLRLLDWKMYARSGRYFVKESEIETNISVKFVIDASASMLHEDLNKVNNTRLRKIEFARLMATTLAHLALEQGDTIGLYAMNESQLVQLSPRQHRQHLHRFVYELLQINAVGVFPQVNDNPLLYHNQGGNKEMIVFVSDMYEHSGEIYKTLEQLSTVRNEVLFFHLMGQNELELNYKGTLTLEDLETGQRVQVDSNKIRKQYKAQLHQHLEKIKGQMFDLEISYNLFSMGDPLDKALNDFLMRRQRLQ